MADKHYGDAINTFKDGAIPPGMLSSPQIAYCVQKYNIIENYEESCLGPATYHMRLGGKVLTWEFGEKVEYLLGENDDKDKNIRKKLTLKPNSLTFVTTIEKFNLPKDIIARFNLKSKWVHQGILLGTGPIVDPELVANLLIPLHNFSNQTIEIEFNSKIISVEFTKTSNPDASLEVDGNKFEYKSNKSRIFDFDKYRKRIGDLRIESSVSSTFEEYDKSIGVYKERLRKFSLLSGIAILAAYIGLVTLVITTYMFISDARNEVNEAKNVVAVYKEEILNYKNNSINSEYIKVQNQLIELRQISETIHREIKINSGNQSADIIKLLNINSKRINEIEALIKEIKKGRSSK